MNKVIKVVNLNLRQLNKIGKRKFIASNEHKDIILACHKV